MYELTDTEIELISNDIDQQGLTYTLLKNELFDHICCDIEEEMKSGLTFNEAYRKVKQQIGPRRIRKIQDETLYLINKKYRRMKKTMYVLGIAIPIIIVVATVFKLQHWPGGGPLFTLALFAMAIFFLPIFVMVKIRDTRRQDEPVPLGFYLTGMISGMLTITGALFKIQYMPGSGVLLSAGLISMAFVFLPMYAIIKIRDASEKKEPVNRTYFILGIFAGIMFIAGTLFKVMHWPGAGMVLLGSWLMVAVILLPLLVLNILKQNANRLNNFLLVILAFTFISLLVLSQLRRPSLNMIDGFVNTEASISLKTVYICNESDELLASAAQSENPSILNSMQLIHSEADRICDFMQELQAEMVLNADGENSSAFMENGRISYREVAGKDMDHRAKLTMLISGYPEVNATTLKFMLESFKETSLSLTQDADLALFIDTQLDLSVPSNIRESWEELYFAGAFMQTATYLSVYQSTVRLIEYELLKELNTRIGK